MKNFMIVLGISLIINLAVFDGAEAVKYSTHLYPLTLGNAFPSVDSSSIFWNPANLVRNKVDQINYGALLGFGGGMSLDYGHYMAYLSPYFTVTSGRQFSQFDVVVCTNSAETKVQTIECEEEQKYFAISMGMNLFKWFAIGVSGKAIKLGFQEMNNDKTKEEGTAWSCDAGILLSFLDGRFSIDILGQNLAKTVRKGTKLGIKTTTNETNDFVHAYASPEGKDTLFPQIIRFGVSIKTKEELTLAVDYEANMEKIFLHNNKLMFGAEKWFKRQVVFRGGYIMSLSGPKDNTLAAGLGYRFAKTKTKSEGGLEKFFRSLFSGFQIEYSLVIRTFEGSITGTKDKPLLYAKYVDIKAGGDYDTAEITGATQLLTLSKTF